MISRFVSTGHDDLINTRPGQGVEYLSAKDIEAYQENLAGHER